MLIRANDLAIATFLTVAMDTAAAPTYGGLARGSGCVRCNRAAAGVIGEGGLGLARIGLSTAGSDDGGMEGLKAGDTEGDILHLPNLRLGEGHGLIYQRELNAVRESQADAGSCGPGNAC